MQNYKVKESDVQNCPVFVEGKECGLPLTQVDFEAKKIARYGLLVYECGLRHRSYFLQEPSRESCEAITNDELSGLKPKACAVVKPGDMQRRDPRRNRAKDG